MQLTLNLLSSYSTNIGIDDWILKQSYLGVVLLQVVVPWAAVSGSGGPSPSAGLLEGFVSACGGSGMEDVRVSVSLRCGFASRLF